MSIQLVLEVLFQLAVLAGGAYLYLDAAGRKVLELRRWLTARA